jgi:hypothetical protein
MAMAGGPKMPKVEIYFSFRIHGACSSGSFKFPYGLNLMDDSTD